MAKSNAKKSSRRTVHGMYSDVDIHVTMNNVSSSPGLSRGTCTTLTIMGVPSWLAHTICKHGRLRKEGKSIDNSGNVRL